MQAQVLSDKRHPPQYKFHALLSIHMQDTSATDCHHTVISAVSTEEQQQLQYQGLNEGDCCLRSKSAAAKQKAVDGSCNHTSCTRTVPELGCPAADVIQHVSSSCNCCKDQMLNRVHNA